MHVKLQLREPKGLITPKGPGFKWARNIKCNIDGSVIRFKAPRHYPRSNAEPTYPKRKYQMDSTPFRYYSDDSIANSVEWGKLDLFRHEWAFNGPWFTGVQSVLRSALYLLKPNDSRYEEVSLFHPRAFEMAIGDYLSYLYASHIDDIDTGKQKFIGPADWNPLNNLPVNAARLSVVPDKDFTHHGSEYFVFFPVADNLIACMHFTPSQLGRGTQQERDKRVNRAPMLELMEKIIDSLQLTLSPEAESQQKKALADMEDTSLVKDYPPLKWGELDKQDQLSAIEN